MNNKKSPLIEIVFRNKGYKLFEDSAIVLLWQYKTLLTKDKGYIGPGTGQVKVK